METTYRPAEKEDIPKLAQLDVIASAGVADYLFQGLVPGMSPAQVIARGLEEEGSPHSFRSVIVARVGGEIAGMAKSFPATMHGISDEMRAFFPRDRLEHLADFFNARVEKSWYLDALCVDARFRGRGIGRRLIECVAGRARENGLFQLSLITFAANRAGLALYASMGFETVRRVRLDETPLIPHRGGCLLLRLALPR